MVNALFLRQSSPFQHLSAFFANNIILDVGGGLVVVSDREREREGKREGWFLKRFLDLHSVVLRRLVFVFSRSRCPPFASNSNSRRPGLVLVSIFHHLTPSNYVFCTETADMLCFTTTLLSIFLSVCISPFSFSLSISTICREYRTNSNALGEL